jgi:hypothetical protein
MDTNNIKLGATYVDKITGFTGVAIGFVTYISGCNQVLIAPRVGDDGKLQEGRWFDEQRLLSSNEALIVLENDDTPGFDSEPPKR